MPNEDSPDSPQEEQNQHVSQNINPEPPRQPQGPVREVTGEKPETICEVKAVRMPPFWRTEPELWFVQAEAQFYSCRVTADASKFYAVISVLDADTLKQISDLVRAPPESGKYNAIKTQLISRFADSHDKRLHKLLNEMDLGSDRPSQLYREMKSLAGGSLSSEALRALWLRRLPENVRCILSASEVIDVDKLAMMADRIIETSSLQYFAVDAVSQQPAGQVCETGATGN